VKGVVKGGKNESENVSENVSVNVSVNVREEDKFVFNIYIFLFFFVRKK
jgi:hypothetical protein